jgi:hypothetical protein
MTRLILASLVLLTACADDPGLDGTWRLSRTLEIESNAPEKCKARLDDLTFQVTHDDPSPLKLLDDVQLIAASVVVTATSVEFVTYEEDWPTHEVPHRLMLDGEHLIGDWTLPGDGPGFYCEWHASMDAVRD